MLEALLFLPLGAGLIMLLVGNAAFCRGLLPLTALGHVTLSLLTVARVARGEQPCALGGLLAPDALGALFLALASLLFLAASIYAVGYLREGGNPGRTTSGRLHQRPGAAASRPVSASFWRP